ncbi:MAG TPA: glycosyltransferase family 2 protein [Candidatus Limnocylindrales bacterium]|nr:glycosyltransferase family 2 protein [Candidatus Limnocylindrales bacterium]
MDAESVADGRSRPAPLVSVVIPTLNAARSIGAAFASLRAQTYPADRIEILVVDGGSSDGTVALAEEAARTDPRIRALGGPGVNTPSALNIGIAAARGEVVWYLGGHGEADPRFLEIGVANLINEPNLGCAGGVIVPTGEGLTARANMIARFSVFGVGRGVYTTSPTRHDIETVQWGAYWKEALERAGLFDPELQFGEDEELNYRVLRAGFRILYDPAMRITYFARATFRSLFRQYRNYGRARFRVLRKHPSFFRLKHIIPPGLVAGLAGAAILPLVLPAFWPLSLLVIGGYAVFVAGASLLLAVRERFPAPHYIAVSLLALHFGYGLGMLAGVADWVRRR